MNDTTDPRAMDPKPKRDNFATDDDFGEAYAYWMARQRRPSVVTPAAKVLPKATVPQAVAKPTKPATPPLASPPPADTGPPPRRSEAEREAWNLSTKARFWRAKTSASANKGK